jgi:hypothetical protein
MNALGTSLVWLAIQVTLLSAATAVVYLLVRRRRPSAGAAAILSGLLLSAVLTLGFISPWPSSSTSRRALRRGISGGSAGGRGVGHATNRGGVGLGGLVE